MKKYIQIFMLLLGINTLLAQYTTIPDPNFESALVAKGYDDIDGDGQVFTADIASLTTLDISRSNISDLTGIEAFVSLTSLNCSRNSLTTLDLTSNTNLEAITANTNSLTMIDISGLTALEDLIVFENSLTALNTSSNTALRSIDLFGNEIKFLDFSNNTLLEDLYIDSNDFREIDLRNGNNENIDNIDLRSNDHLGCVLVDDPSYSDTNWTNKPATTSYTTDRCQYTSIPDPVFEAYIETLITDDNSGDGQVPSALINEVKTLFISGISITDFTGIQDFGALESINISGGTYTEINLSNALVLNTVIIHDSQLTSLDFTSNTNLELIGLSSNSSLGTIDLGNGNNTNIPSLSFSDNTALTCILVDDLDYATTNWTSVDSSLFKVGACIEYTEILDSKFEDALATYDDIAGDNQVPTANIEMLTELNISEKEISNLAGIEDFVALERLYAQKNSISTVDISNLEHLEELNFSENALTTLDLRPNTKLKEVMTHSNLLTAVNVSGLSSLETLNIYGNLIEVLELSTNESLIVLDVFQNELTSLDLTANVNLEKVYIDTNELNFLDLRNGANSNITDIALQNNSDLTCVLVSDLDNANTNWTNKDDQTFFTENYCRYTAIPDPNFELALAVYDDVANDNQVPTELIEVVENLDLDEAEIVSLSGIEDFTALKSLSAVDNGIISEVDVTNNVALESLNLSVNGLGESLDLSKNVNLKSLTLTFTNLEYIVLNSGANTLIETIDLQENNSLTCVIVDDIDYATANWTNIAVGASFATDLCGYTAIPDANFEAALEDYDDIKGDGLIPTAAIETLTKLDASDKDIVSIEGIQAFVALEELDIEDNEITSLDLSKLIHLKDLDIEDNPISSLDISQNIALEYLDIADTDITAIDLQYNVVLKRFSAEDTSIATIDLTKNTLLEEVDLEGNNLSEIDVKLLTLLEKLDVSDNNLTTIDVSKNILLKTLKVNANKLSDLNVLANTELEFIDASSMKNLTVIDLTGLTKLINFQAINSGLTSLDVSDCTLLKSATISGNELTDLDFSQNNVMILVNVSKNNLQHLDLRNIDLESLFLTTTSNPDLTCISVDDVIFALEKYEGQIDETTSFSKLCGEFTYIPDPNFELALIDHGIDDIVDSHIENVNTEFVFSLDISDSNISDLTGMEAFQTVTALNVSGNKLTNADFSPLTDLQSIDVSDNQIRVLDFSMLTDLSNVKVSNNDLFELNLQNRPTEEINTLEATGNDELSCILVSDATYAAANFSNIDSGVSFSETDCTTYITILDNDFEEALEDYDDIPGDNQVPLKNIYNLKELDLGGKDIVDLAGIEHFVALEELDIDDNSLTGSTVDLSQNTNLKILKADENDFSEGIDLSALTLLEDLDLDNCRLTSLDLSSNDKLRILDLEENSFADGINLSANTLLEELDIENCRLKAIDLTGLTALQKIDLTENSLSGIDFLSNAALTHIEISDNDITSLDLSSNINLVELVAFDNRFLTEVEFGTIQNVQFIRLNDTAIETLNIENFEELRFIFVSDTNLKILDAFNSAQLNVLEAEDCKLEQLSIPSNSFSGDTISVLSVKGNPNLYCIQTANPDVAEEQHRDDIDDQTSFNYDCQSLEFEVTVLLEGAYDEVSTGVMFDNLNDNDVLPTTSPYADAAEFTGISFNGPGGRSVVDWVEVQLRNPNDISEIVHRESALLQQNGIIISSTGSSLEISAWHGEYYIAIAHRNHLTIASNTAHFLNDEDFELNLTNVSNVLNGVNALSDMGNSFYAMPAGDVDGNGQIQNADIDAANTNIGGSGYSDSDTDMNGQVQNSDIQSIILKNSGKGEQLFLN